MRVEVAEDVVKRIDLYMRRLRGKLRALRSERLGGPNAASLLDEDDVMSSVWRRLDLALVKGTFKTGHGSDLWGYVHGITHRVIQQRLRQGARDLELFAFISDTERDRIAGLAETELDRLAPLLRASLNKGEWETLVLRSRIRSTRELAAAAGVSEVTVRKRWSRAITVVRKAIVGIATPPPPPRAGFELNRTGLLAA
ncbi:MAG: hypothetical protein Q8L55_12505 [Phycisphaerales bacterium]|nr:hypothetical protein [Phycisphaerales bacterium]